MNKLKRYLGLAAALLLLLTVVPFPGSGPSAPTPFASIATVMTVLVHPAGRFWIDVRTGSSVTHFLEGLNSCRAEVERRDCQGSFHSVETFVTRHQPELEMLGLFERYSSARRAKASLGDATRLMREMKTWQAPAPHKNSATDTAPSTGAGPFPGQTPPQAAASPTVTAMLSRLREEEVQRFQERLKEQSARVTQLELESARLEELESQVASALKKYAAERRPGLVGAIYTVHALLLLLVVLMVRKRHGVGAAILWPFAALIGAAKGSARAAKSLHERV